MGQKNENLINELVAGINANPARIYMYIEEAVVIDEKSVADIVDAAIHAVHADAKTSAEIIKAATSIAPNRADIINAAARKAIEAEAEIKRVFEKIEKEHKAGIAQVQEVRAAEFPEVVMKAILVNPLDLKPVLNSVMQAPSATKLEK